MSYKIINQIKKSTLPRPLKTVLEAYAYFANKDGTSIRPTEASVALRASSSRSVVSRHTQTLVATGLLVHDRDEHGIYLKHAYGENGVWAYVYHVDASKLNDPALVAQWEERQNEIIKKRREVGAKNTTTKWAKGTSGNPKGHSNLLLLEQSKVLQTPPQQFATNPPQQNGVAGAQQFATQTLPSDPRSADPSDNPSARSRAVGQNQVSELVSEDRSEASPPHPSDTIQEQANIDQGNEWYYTHGGHDHDEHLGTYISAEDLHVRMFPGKTWTHEDICLMVDLAREVGGIRGITHGAEIMEAAWEWNQIHKTGKMRLFSVAELAKALRSDNPRSLLNQMRAHTGCKLCMDTCVVCRQIVLDSTGYHGEDVTYCDGCVPDRYKQA